MSCKNNQFWENYKRIGETTVATLGSKCEVVIHDFKDVSHSVIYVAGNVTSRAIGAPLTDLVLGIWHRHGDTAQDLPAYRSSTKDGKILRSSTTFIRDPEGKIKGAWCINFDITDMLGFFSFIDELTFMPELSNVQSPESYATSMNETIESCLENAIRQKGKVPLAMSRKERIALIKHLEEQGAFEMKGAVKLIGQRMSISKYTVYAYLKEARIFKGLQEPDYSSEVTKV